MPAARGLAGDIAELVGRPASEGWVFVRYLQDEGIFPKGRGGRGGTGSPRAEPWQGVILLLSMLLGSAPKAAIADAAQLYNLAFTRAWIVKGGAFSPVERSAEGGTFGDVFTGLIQCLRLGYSPEAMPFRIFIGIVGDNLVGQFFLRSRDDADGDAVEAWEFSRPIGFDTSDLIHSMRSFPGFYLKVIADKLGAIASSGGGGESDVILSDAEDDHGDVEIPLAASADADTQAVAVH